MKPEIQDSVMLDSVIGKDFNICFWSSPTRRPKRELFLQMGLEKREYSNLDCILTFKIGLLYRYYVGS
jgi:hypothetical protein